MASRVFEVVQYEKNPRTGEDLGFNESVIVEALSKHKSIRQWAWICHDKDTWTDEDERKEPEYKKSGEPKPKHWHIVMRFADAYDVKVIARWFNVEPQYVEMPKGRGAFIDKVEYLTHERPEQQAKGKYRYNDAEVFANFDWRSEVDEARADRERYGEGSLDPTTRTQLKVRYEGLTLKEVRKLKPVEYMKNEDKFKRLRMAYIQEQEPPKTRINYYITGEGGIGKGLMCRALARSLYPGLDDYDCFYEVGAKGAAFEGYDGQPVIIWNDRRAVDLLTELNGRGNVFNVFDTHPTKQRQNIKYGSINLCNAVNLVNSVEPYSEFLDSLAGEYTDRSGVEHLAEDKSQSYRRFWFIMPIRAEDCEVLINKEIMRTGKATEYETLAHISYKFADMRKRLGCRDDVIKYLEAKAVEPVVEKHREIIEKENATLSDEEINKALSSVGYEYKNGEVIQIDKDLPFT